MFLVKNISGKFAKWLKNNEKKWRGISIYTLKVTMSKRRSTEYTCYFAVPFSYFEVLTQKTLPLLTSSTIYKIIPILVCVLLSRVRKSLNEFSMISIHFLVAKNTSSSRFRLLVLYLLSFIDKHKCEILFNTFE